MSDFNNRRSKNKKDLLIVDESDVILFDPNSKFNTLLEPDDICVCLTGTICCTEQTEVELEHSVLKCLGFNLYK